jgi:hypothetical protein
LRGPRRHALRQMAVSMLGMRHFSLCKSRGVNHRVVEQAPGAAGSAEGRSSMPTVRGQHETTQMRTGAMATRNMPGLAYSTADGPVSQARHRGYPSNSSDQISNQLRRAGQHRADERIIWLRGPADRDGKREWHAHLQTPPDLPTRRWPAAEKQLGSASILPGMNQTVKETAGERPGQGDDRQPDSEGNSFRNPCKKDTKNNHRLALR